MPTSSSWNHQASPARSRATRESMTSRSIGLLALLATAPCATVACNAQPTFQADAAPAPSHGLPDSTEPSAGSSRSRGSGGLASSRLPPPPLGIPRAPCRAVSVQGDVRAESDSLDAGIASPVAPEGELPEDAWIRLGRGARLVAKDPRTTRETIFHGPGRARACAGHREESWIASGAFESERGAGETPGAEEWVLTPQAVVRFASAKLRVDVSATQTTVNVANGTALLWVPADARRTRAEAAADAGAPPRASAAEDPWQRIGEGAVRIASSAVATPMDAARSALGPCTTIARRSEELTRVLLTRRLGDGAAQGDAETLVTEQVSTRELARAACAVAAVRVRALAASDGRADLEQALGAANDVWTALPSAPPSPPARP
jgi:hypothetical protein